MKIPVFRSLSHWLLRVPLIIVFIQQGLSKMPVTQETADAFGLPFIVWWFVAFGELGAGLGRDTIYFAKNLISVKACCKVRRS